MSMACGLAEFFIVLIEGAILRLDENVRLGLVARRKHRNGAVVQSLAVLGAQLVDVAELERTVGASCHARGLAACLAQAVATIALAGHTQLFDELGLAVGAAHHAHAATDALALVLDNRTRPCR